MDQSNKQAGMQEGTKISQPSAIDQPVRSENDQYTGTIIGDRYEVLSLVGKGGMGAVYKVRHQQLKTLLALKVLRHSKDLEQSDIARFEAEAHAAGRLRHVSLAGIYDYGITSDGMPYFVMDFIDGESLSTYMATKGHLNEKDALAIFIQICDGLIYAHSKGIVHRDIKPGNIMLYEEGDKLRARLVDFGIAKELTSDRPALTQTGQLVGSPLYMSPEQCHGRPIDVRSDIYSLGCTMFEALTGYPPFDGESSTQVLVKHINERAPLFRSVVPQLKVNTALERVVLQMLEKEPDDRYQSMTDVRRDLELIQQGKNPVKEVSQLRNRLQLAGKIARWIFLVLLISGSTMTIVWWLSQVTVTPWAKLEAQARQRMMGGPHSYDGAEVAYKEAVKAALAGKAPDSDKERLLIELAHVQSLMHKPQQAMETLAEASHVSANHAEDAARGRIFDQLAEVYLGEHQLNKAEEFAREAVAIKSRQFGEVNAYTARSMVRLSTILQIQHKYSEAEPLARKVVLIQSKLPGYADSIELADAYRHLSHILYNQNKIDEAVDPAQQALHIYLQLEGADDPTTQRTAHFLIDMLKRLHRDQEAVEVARDAHL